MQATIRNNTDFTFEITLGGNTITHTLLDAIAAGMPVSVWYFGLESAEQYIERVAARVARGGHDIPEELIRSRYKPPCATCFARHRACTSSRSTTTRRHSTRSSGREANVFRIVNQLDIEGTENASPCEWRILWALGSH